MSTFKKVISLVLCAAILVGSFALVGGLVAPVASAEEVKVGTTTRVKKSTDANGAEKILTDVTGIMSYDDLVAAYGSATGTDGLTDGFVYIGAEFYEPDGTLTDYYINAGDMLTARVYLKSNMYVGESTLMQFFNNSVWDVKEAVKGTTTVNAQGYASGAQAESNKSHPAWTSNGYKCMVTSLNINSGWIKSTCGFDTAYLTGTDFIQVQTKCDSAVSSYPYDMTSDEWLLTYNVTAKAGLADGTELSIESPDVIWGTWVNGTKHDTRKRNYVPTAHKTTTVSVVGDCKAFAPAFDAGTLDYVIYGFEHTFVIGKPEAAVTYDVNFFENDGTTPAAETAAYEVDTAVKFPEAAENQIAWAVIKEGLDAPGTLLTPDADGNYSYTVTKPVSFMRVLADDKFDVELSLGADSSVDEALLPEGVSYDAAKNALVIALPVGGTFDLSTIPAEALSKKDNTFVDWNVAGVTGASSVEGTVLTLGSVNGKGGTAVTAEIAANWKTAEYTARYFLNKEAYENGEDPIGEEIVVANAAAKFTSDNLVADKKFAGWYRADTNEFVNDKKKTVGQYTYSQDLDFYADWTDYANLATFMIRDYENGEGWAVAYVDKGDAAEGKTIPKATLKTIKDNAVNALGANFVQILDMDPDLIPEGETMKDHIAVQAYGDGSFVNDLVYSGNKVYYIATTMSYSVTWKVPVYDAEAGEFTEEYTEFNTSTSTAYTPTNGIDAYFATAKFTEKVETPTGWEISSWIDEATGEAAVFNENGMYELRGTENKAVTLKAVYTLIEYTVSFNLNNIGNPDIVMLDGTFTLGEEIVIDGASFTLNGEPTVLPVVGKDSTEQPDGGYIVPEGYKFAGWTYSTGAENVDAAFPVKLTAELIGANLIKGSVCFSAKWDAKEYSLKFYIINANGEEELYGTEYKVKVGENLTTYKDVSNEAIAEINAKAPEGKSFVKIWLDKSTGAPDSLTKMPARDMVYVASYVNSTIEVYIDYNNLDTPDLNTTLQKFKDVSLTYGQDITTVISEAPYYERSFKTCVERANISDSNKPANASEIVGWNVYYVEANADPYTAEWKSGVNAQGTNVAATTLIFQPVWKAHKDMFFRAYDTDDKIYLALGKDFKLHYWNNGAIVEKYKDTQYNTNPETNVVLFFTIGIEWDNLSMTFSAFPIPKSVFTLEGMLGLFEMLGNLIGSLL